MIYKYENININYDIIGSGNPIILLHGWGTNYNTFKNLSNLLKNYFEVFLIDLPGFGKSGEPPHIYNLDNYLHFLNTFIEELQIENPIILGHSFGGRIAIKYSAISKNISKLILVDSAGIKHKKKIGTRLSILKYKWLKFYYRKTKNITKFNQLIKVSGSSDYISSSNIMKGTMTKVINENLKSQLSKIKVETLIIWGKDDQATPYSDAILMKNKIKNSGLVTFENVGHFPYLERKNQFNRVIASFLGVDLND